MRISAWARRHKVWSALIAAFAVFMVIGLLHPTQKPAKTAGTGAPPTATGTAAPSQSPPVSHLVATPSRPVAKPPGSSPPLAPSSLGQPSTTRSRTTQSPNPIRTAAPTTHAAVPLPPKPTSTVGGAATDDLCGAPPNPYGYNFCGRGGAIIEPKPDVCAYFSCIPSFWNGKGYMEECRDGSYSMSGGRSGACSHHGGELREVFSG